MHPASQEFFEFGLRTTLDEYVAARRRRFDYVGRLDTLLGDGALLLTPTVAVAGLLPDGRVRATDPIALTAAESMSTAVQNITGHPAITVPAGQHANGVPFGLQFTGPRWSDLLLLDVAATWEQAHPWPRVAPGYTEFSLA